MNTATKNVLKFIDKSGGIEKVTELLARMRTIPDENRAEFIRQAAKTDPGARQIMACALLGLLFAEETHRIVKEKAC